MAKYKISWLEVVEGAKKRAKVSLEGVNGEVTIWADFPNFEQLAAGSEVEGDIVPAKDPKYPPTLYPPKPSPIGQRPPWAKKESGAVAAAKITGENVKITLDRKEEGIALSGSARDATMIVTTFYSSTGLSDQEIQTKWENWRKWLYGKYTEPFV